MLLAAVGGPKWDTHRPGRAAPRAGAARPAQGARPVREPAPGARRSRRCYDASPLRREVVEGTDLLVVRELTGGIYFGEKTRDRRRAPATSALYTVEEIERIARIAFGAARSKVTSVDKANVLETSRLWREVVRRVHAEEFPHVELEHVLVDTTAMQLVTAPRHFDVILTENMFGDILSDEASMLTGSLGLLPERLLGDGGGPGLFEPVHGSAPDIAGQGDRQPAGDVPVGRAACCATDSVATTRPRP